MATSKLDIIIKAQDQASKTLASLSDKTYQLTGSVDKFGKSNDKAQTKVKGLTTSFIKAELIVAALGKAWDFVSSQFGLTIDASNKLNNSLVGLSSIAQGFGQDATKATKAARDLAADGLMAVSDSATGLKNLLAAGFNLPQAIKLMQRFKDSAAFGRQGSLSFGQAIVGATEGIKNQNSVLVDNAGVTKNLSVMWDEYAASLGKKTAQLTEDEIRQAAYNGILKETRFQVGDAAKLTEELSGRQAKLSASTETLRAKIGDALSPAVSVFVENAQGMVEWAIAWFDAHGDEIAVGLEAMAIGLTNVSGIIGTVTAGANSLVEAIKPMKQWLHDNKMAVDSVTWALGILFGPALVQTVVTGAIKMVVSLQTMAANALIAGSRMVYMRGVALALGAWDVLAALGRFAAAGWSVNAPFAVLIGTLAGVLATLKLIAEATNALDKSGNARWNVKNQINAAGKLWFGMENGVPGFNAKGTDNWRGGPTWVGEEGPELVNLPRGSQVIPNHRLGSQSGGGQSVSIGEVHLHNQTDTAAFLREIAFELN